MSYEITCSGASDCLASYFEPPAGIELFKEFHQLPCIGSLDSQTSGWARIEHNAKGWLIAGCRKRGAWTPDEVERVYKLLITDMLAPECAALQLLRRKVLAIMRQHTEDSGNCIKQVKDAQHTKHEALLHCIAEHGRAFDFLSERVTMLEDQLNKPKLSLWQRFRKGFRRTP